MKILYLVHQFYPEHYGGTEKFVLHLAQQMQAANHTVKVVTYDGRHLPLEKSTVTGQHGSTIRQWLKTLLRTSIDKLGQHRKLLARLRERLPNPIAYRTYTHEGIAVTAFAHQRQPRRMLHQMADRTLTSFAHKLLAAERPDLIHIGHPLRLAEFAHVAQARQIPYLVTLTDYWMLCGRFFLITQGEELCAGPRGGLECRRACPKLDQQQVEQRLAAARQICRQAQAVIAPSHFLADCVQREFGPLSVQVIPYGIATADLQLNQRNYPTDEPLVILFAGRFKAEKGIALLLTAFRQLPTAKIRLEIYGSGPFEPMVRQAATDDRRIHFGGVYTQSELNTLLNRVDVVVIPSLWHENLPLIMQEAQACGVPTLVSDVGGMTECVTDGVNGFTFRVGDVADLQRKLQLIIDQPEMLNAIKANIRQPKRGQYQVTSLAQEAALYLEKYAKILAPPVVATSITHEVPSSPLTRSVSRANDSEFL